MRFATELNPSELPATLRLMTGIVGWQIWKRRIEGLNASSRTNPMWDSFLRDRHGLELAFGDIHHHLQSRGKCPWPPRTAEEYRFYSFIAVAVRVYQRLSRNGRRRFAGAVRSALKKEFGLGPLAFEMNIVAHLMGRGFDVELHDLELGGGFDFLASRAGTSIEVECKHISADIGRQIHRRKLHDVGGFLYPAMSRAVDRGIGGQLVKVTLPGRLTSNSEQKRAIAERVTAVLAGDICKIDDSVCQVSAREFSLDGSPFSAGRGHDLTTDGIEQFLNETFGIENANVLVNWRPGHAAVLIHFQSEVSDKVLGEIFKHLKGDAKKQFSGNLPGFLCVHLADLHHEQLLDLFETARSGTATGIEGAVHLLLQRRPNLYGIALMADGEVRLTEKKRDKRIITTAVQETGPSWVIMNATHELAGTDFLDQLFV